MCTTVCLLTRVCFSSATYLSFAVQALYTAALTPPDKELTESITKSSFFQLVYKNSLDFKEKSKKNITFLAWQHPKEAVVFFFFSVILALPLAHKHICKSNPAHTHTHSSSAAQIWLWLHRSQSERICGIAVSSLPQTFSLSLSLHGSIQPSPTDFTKKLSQELLYPIPGQTNLLPLKLYTP